MKNVPLVKHREVSVVKGGHFKQDSLRSSKHLKEQKTFQWKDKKKEKKRKENNPKPMSCPKHGQTPTQVSSPSTQQRATYLVQTRIFFPLKSSNDNLDSSFPARQSLSVDYKGGRAASRQAGRQAGWGSSKKRKQQSRETRKRAKERERERDGVRE